MDSASDWEQHSESSTTRENAQSFNIAHAAWEVLADATQKPASLNASSRVCSRAISGHTERIVGMDWESTTALTLLLIGNRQSFHWDERNFAV